MVVPYGAHGHPGVGSDLAYGEHSRPARPHRAGRLNVNAFAIHEGRAQQLWQVEIRRPEDDKLVARGQVRLQNIEARNVSDRRITRGHWDALTSATSGLSSVPSTRTAGSEPSGLSPGIVVLDKSLAGPLTGLAAPSS